MKDFWLKLWVWIKVIVVSALVLYGVVFIAMNSSQSAVVWWWFRREYQIPVLFLVFFTFVAGVIAAILVRTTFATIRQIRELRSRNRTEKLAREVADMHAKAARLQTKNTAGTPSSVAGSPDEGAE